jgi:riboflavin synthase
MFTGIIERSLPIASVADAEGKRRITLASPWDDVKHGESIAINGVCLTVASIDKSEITFDVIRETLDKTNLGSLVPGDLVHVERAMQIGSRFDGHFVQGHVDGVATVVKQVANPEDWRLVGRVPEHLAKYLIPKGSITVDGVSMTLAKVAGPHFELAIIPTTLQITQLGNRPVGYRINVECDVMAKTIVSFLERRESATSDSVDEFWK